MMCKNQTYFIGHSFLKHLASCFDDSFSVCIVHVKREVEDREKSLALLRPGSGIKQDFEV